jgi:hypothetical protein
MARVSFLTDTDPTPPHERDEILARMAEVRREKITAMTAGARRVALDATGTPLTRDQEEFEPEAKPLHAVVPERILRIRGEEHWRCPLHGWTTRKRFFVWGWSSTEPWSCVVCARASRERQRTCVPRANATYLLRMQPGMKR